MVRFKMQRYAALTLRRPVQEKVQDLRSNFQVAKIETLPVPNVPTNKVFVIATTYFDAPALSGMHDPVLTHHREHAEAAISAFADTLAVATGGGRILESCKPYFAVWWPQGSSPDVGKDWSTPSLKLRPVVTGQRVGIQALTDRARDRRSGLSLLAEAMSTEHEVGRFIGFCRVLEDAFKTPLTQLPTPLAAFLEQAELCYSDEEVHKWVELRGAAAHGDLLRSKFHVLETHARSYTNRIEQAALDVFMNKANWHAPDIHREQIWVPTDAIFSESHLRGVEHKKIGLSLLLVDPFTNWEIAGDCFLTPNGDVAYPRGALDVNLTMDVIARPPNG